ncbi:MAG: prepilin peptidase [Syntrophaceae bacterium]|nr:prepilin peptidase [Syntrophaceae bacterium]
MIHHSQAIILIILLVVAVVFDLRERRVPNWLTLPFMAAGVAYHAAANGLPGVLFSLMGLALGISLLIIFYAAGGMGAGDVKLMGAVGSLLGPANVLYAFVYSALIGGIYAAAVLYRHSALRSSIERLASVPVDFARTGQWFWSPSPASRKIPRICYGVAISLGTGIYVLRSL